MPNIGVPELVVILVILLLLFGAKKLPELARSIGDSAKELRKSIKDDDKVDNEKKQASKKQDSKKS
jgi:sec-independent protein translocase protein TatA